VVNVSSINIFRMYVLVSQQPTMTPVERQGAVSSKSKRVATQVRERETLYGKRRRVRGLRSSRRKGDYYHL
jgi:hypothetical protein